MIDSAGNSAEHFGEDVAFKYCDPHGVRILQNLELKITPPSEFNDPFEFTPHVICTSPGRRLKHLVQDKEEEEAMYQSQKKAGFQGNKRAYRRALRKLQPELVREITPWVPEAVAHLQSTMLSKYSEDQGVLCLSEAPDSMLMWGHYCSAHRGIVIGFNRVWEWFQGPKGLHPVKYVRDRVIWDTSVKPGSARELQTAKQMVFSKNADWAYEKELRQMFLLKGLRKRALADGRAGHFLPLKPEAIKCVVLGLRCSEETEKTVRTALVTGGLSHVSVWRAVLHASKFAVNFAPA